MMNRHANHIFDFLINYKVVNECWEYGGNINDKGYGRFNYNDEIFFAHRLSYALHYDDFDPNLCICHKCDNRKCMNPNHLFQGTRTDNNRDMVKKGRHGHKSKTHCARGHEYTKDNTLKRYDNGRDCRICKNYNNEVYKYRKGIRKTKPKSVSIN